MMRLTWCGRGATVRLATGEVGARLSLQDLPVGWEVGEEEGARVGVAEGEAEPDPEPEPEPPTKAAIGGPGKVYGAGGVLKTYETKRR
jgi:hypothetical protein